MIAYLGGPPPRHHASPIRSYEPLREAIEKRLMTSVRDISRIITKARTRDEEQTEKYNVMVQDDLIDNGYCPNCVDVVSWSPPTTWKD